MSQEYFSSNDGMIKINCNNMQGSSSRLGEGESKYSSVIGC